MKREDRRLLLKVIVAVAAGWSFSASQLPPGGPAYIYWLMNLGFANAFAGVVVGIDLVLSCFRGDPRL